MRLISSHLGINNFISSKLLAEYSHSVSCVYWSAYNAVTAKAAFYVRLYEILLKKRLVTVQISNSSTLNDKPTSFVYSLYPILKYSFFSSSVPN